MVVKLAFNLPVGTYNRGQCIWIWIEKSSKTGQDRKNLIFTFACFLTATVKL